MKEDTLKILGLFAPAIGVSSAYFYERSFLIAFHVPARFVEISLEDIALASLLLIWPLLIPFGVFLVFIKEHNLNAIKDRYFKDSAQSTLWNSKLPLITAMFFTFALTSMFSIWWGKFHASNLMPTEMTFNERPYLPVKKNADHIIIVDKQDLSAAKTDKTGNAKVRFAIINFDYFQNNAQSMASSQTSKR